MTHQVTTFFDGGCPLCRREVQHYRRLDRDETVQWIDISAPGTQLDVYGISRDTAMARFHVLVNEKQMQTGAAAFVALWSALPYYRWLAKLMRIPGIIPLLERAYQLFARWRLARRQRHCPI